MKNLRLNMCRGCAVNYTESDFCSSCASIERHKAPTARATKEYRRALIGILIGAGLLFTAFSVVLPHLAKAAK